MSAHKKGPAAFAAGPVSLHDGDGRYMLPVTQKFTSFGWFSTYCFAATS